MNVNIEKQSPKLKWRLKTLNKLISDTDSYYKLSVGKYGLDIERDPDNEYFLLVGVESPDGEQFYIRLDIFTIIEGDYEIDDVYVITRDVTGTEIDREHVLEHWDRQWETERQTSVAGYLKHHPYLLGKDAKLLIKN